MIAARTLLTPLLATVLFSWNGGGTVAFGEEGEVPTAAPGAETETASATPPPSAAKLQGLTESLGSEDYRTRLGAQTDLLKLADDHAETVAEALVGPYLTATDADLRARLRLTLWNAKLSAINERPIGFVGIQMQDAFQQFGNQLPNAIQRTVLVTSVIPNTAAKRHGLRVGDQIVAVDGKAFDAGSPSLLFKQEISARTVGEPVELKILRGPDELTVKLDLGQRPKELMDYGSDERERLELAFGAFLREAAEKRGLPLPSTEEPEPSGRSGAGEGFEVNPFEP